MVAWINEPTASIGSLSELQVLGEEFRQIHAGQDSGQEQSSGGAGSKTLDELYERIHVLGEPRTALCLSGGGIRSATYCLGALQALASHVEKPKDPGPESNQLERFHYLSTVSGGGYIGGWLSALIARNDYDYGKVCSMLKRPAPASADAATATTPFVWLRKYSNYLAPRRGWSPDTGSMVGTYIRNLLVVWSVLIPALLAFLLVPMVHLWALNLFTDEAGSTASHSYPLLGLAVVVCVCSIALPVRSNQPSMAKFKQVMLLLVLASALYGLSLSLPFVRELLPGPRRQAMFLGPMVLLAYWFVGTLLAVFRRKQQEGYREQLARAGGRALALAVAWIAVHALVYQLPVVLADWGGYGLTLIGIGGLAGVAAAAGGFWQNVAGAKKSQMTEKMSDLALHGAAAFFVVVILGAGGASINFLLIEGVNRSDATFPSSRTLINLRDTRDAVAGVLEDAGKELESKVAPAAKALQQTLDSQLREEAANQLRVAAHGVLDGASSAWARRLNDVSAKLLAFAQRYGDALKNPGGRWPALCAIYLSIVLLLTFGFGISGRGVNRFGLGNFYANRLVRGYLGASNESRRPDLDTDFDPGDDLPMADIHRQAEGTHKPRLFHIVNAALNLVSASRLEWQQRKAGSFTISPLHSGSWMLGYQRTQNYTGGPGIYLGRAVAISGAAASPNMGYHSSAFIAFILTFFNVRLGWWMPNPGDKGRAAWNRSDPPRVNWLIFQELFGRTGDQYQSVYLSDGGHFENLGLYEMVRRRCKRILVVDASCDPEFQYDDLAAAIYRIRSDIGAEIEFESEMEIKKVPDRICRVAKIKYPEYPKDATKWGTLIYVKPLLDKYAPVDVRRYGASHAAGSDCFPHQSTADQFFDEDQFESYRKLGLHNMQQALEAIGSIENPNEKDIPKFEPAGRAEVLVPNPNNTDPKRGVKEETGGSKLASSASKAFSSWTSAGVLAAAVTVGGAVSVAGTLALKPDAAVGVSGNVGIANGSSVGVSGSVGVDRDKSQVGVTGDVGIDPNNARVGVNGNVGVDEKSKVTVVGTVKLSDDSKVAVTGSTSQAKVLEQLVEVLRQALKEVRSMNDKLDSIDKNVTRIGPRREVIEGREGAR